ncbi:MAG: hypothetical protein U0794_06290 [Isosphaeraceae bacterium]
MSTRKDSPRKRSFRPKADSLESRQLLSGVVSGTDIDGDTWTLRLVGPGSINVVKQDDGSGVPGSLDSETEINSITIGGTDPLRSQLIGSIQRSSTGDGKVFFQQMNGLPARSERFTGVGLGMVSINMPGFWLGNTTPAGTTATAVAPPSISLPDGVVTFRFGGVDRTHNLPTVTSTVNATSDTAAVELGLPMFGGTRIVIDKAISTTQTAPPSTTGGTNRTVQRAVRFTVSGRLQLFQANAIEGDASKPPGQFTNQDPTAADIAGTESSRPDHATASAIDHCAAGVVKAPSAARSASSGRRRIPSTSPRSSRTQPSKGRTESATSRSAVTTNVMLIAPSGARDLYFGKGMDTVEVRTHVINTLKANRGAVNSNVVVDRQISLVDFGGDVVDTNVLAGYSQNFTTIIDTVTGQSTSIFGGGSPAAPPGPENAQPSGGMTVHVAGDITNSVFAASTEPFTGVFGPNMLVLPTGNINAKVEGVVNNAVATPDSPSNAFYAQKVNLNKGPVAPPNVPEAPYPVQQQYPFLPASRRRTRPAMVSARPQGEIRPPWRARSMPPTSLRPDRPPRADRAPRRPHDLTVSKS